MTVLHHLLPALFCLLVADAIAKATATSRGKKGSAKAIAEAVSSASSQIEVIHLG
jgi:hypothetical protein